MPEAPMLPPTAISDITRQMAQLSQATLAAAIITASGRPHSIQQAFDLMRDIQFAMHPQPGSGAYSEWKRTSGAALNKVHGPT
jgi:hypothetical protein